MVRRFTPAELVAAHEEMTRRVWAVVDIITAVARKTRRDYLPAGFEPLLQTRRRTIHPYSGRETVQVRFDMGSTLEFPIVLLAASNRDVAVWARERIRACRHVSFQKAKKRIADDIVRAETRIAAEQRTLDIRRRELANLGKAPRYETPTRYPKPKKQRPSA